MLAYSTKGLIRVKHALSLMELARMFRADHSIGLIADAFDVLVQFQRYCFNTCTSRSQ